MLTVISFLLILTGILKDFYKLQAICQLVRVVAYKLKGATVRSLAHYSGPGLLFSALPWR
jgi:hypothetical protein